MRAGTGIRAIRTGSPAGCLRSRPCRHGVAVENGTRNGRRYGLLVQELTQHTQLLRAKLFNATLRHTSQRALAGILGYGYVFGSAHVHTHTHTHTCSPGAETNSRASPCQCAISHARTSIVTPPCIAATEHSRTGGNFSATAAATAIVRTSGSSVSMTSRSACNLNMPVRRNDACDAVVARHIVMPIAMDSQQHM